MLLSFKEKLIQKWAWVKCQKWEPIIDKSCENYLGKNVYHVSTFLLAGINKTEICMRPTPNG